MNLVILIGNLGADPELRYTSAGTPVCNLRLATNRTYKDANGVKQEKTSWHRITLWGKQAEVAAQYLTKGRQVSVTGRIEYSQTGEGENVRYFTDIVCDRLEFVGPRPSHAPAVLASGEGAPVAADDVPF